MRDKSKSAPVSSPTRGNSYAANVATPAAPSLKEISEKQADERLRLFGDKATWDAYKASFAPMLQAAIGQGLFVDRKEVKTFFRDLELQSEPAFDGNGALILMVKDYGEDRILGLTRDNITAEGSDPRLAYKLMLAKINVELNAKEKDRDSLETFKADWALLTQLSAKLASSPDALQRRAKEGARFLQVPVQTSFHQRFKKLVVKITH
jgi:hypothetical protein